MEQHQISSLSIAGWLVNQSFVEEVNHPGLMSYPQYELDNKQMLGTAELFSIKVNQPMEEMRKWINELNIFRIGISWVAMKVL